MSSCLHKSNCTSECQWKITTQMCSFFCLFVCFNIDWSDVCVFACRNCMHHHIQGCLCGTGRPFSKYPETPQELPRAERTASVCVLVPSKQGNLENTKGAANKHNLIPPSSYTWRWILQHYSEDACLHVCASICMCERDRVCMCVMQCLVDLTRRAVMGLLQVCMWSSVYVL